MSDHLKQGAMAEWSLNLNLNIHWAAAASWESKCTPAKSLFLLDVFHLCTSSSLIDLVVFMSFQIFFIASEVCLKDSLSLVHFLIDFFPRPSSNLQCCFSSLYLPVSACLSRQCCRVWQRIRLRRSCLSPPPLWKIFSSLSLTSVSSVWPVDTCWWWEQSQSWIFF